MRGKKVKALRRFQRSLGLDARLRQVSARVFRRFVEKQLREWAKREAAKHGEDRR